MTAGELTAFVHGKMAGYARPRAFVEVAAIPRLANGKPDYEAAKALAGQGLQQSDRLTPREDAA